jgi:hypothetical protein
MDDKADQEQDEKQNEQELGDPSESHRHAAETQHSRDYREDQKYQRVVEHFLIPRTNHSRLRATGSFRAKKCLEGTCSLSYGSGSDVRNASCSFECGGVTNNVMATTASDVLIEYPKYTGKLGVCLATSGPCGIHLLNGLYDAKMDGQPVLAITGMHFHDLIGTLVQQDVDP